MVNSNFKKDKYIVSLISCDKNQLKILVELGCLTESSLVKNDTNQTDFIKAGSIEEIKDLFTSKKRNFLAKGKQITDEVIGIINELTKFTSLSSISSNHKLEIPDKLWDALNEYLEDNIYTIYLTTGNTNDGKPAFIILLKNDSSPMKIGSQVTVDTTNWNAEDFKTWPDIANKNAKILEISK